MQGGNSTKWTRRDPRIIKMASKYTLEYCEGVLRANPDGTTLLLAHILEKSDLDLDKMAERLSVGPAHHKKLTGGLVRIRRRIV